MVKEFWQKAASGGGGFFTSEKLMWHWPIGAMQSAAAVALMPLLIFCGIHRSNDSMIFSGLDNPQIAPFPWWLGPHLIHDSFGQPESPIQMASPLVQPLYRVHERDQQTDRATPSVAIAAMQPNNNNTSKSFLAQTTPIKAWSGSNGPFVILTPAIIFQERLSERCQILYAGRIYQVLALGWYTTP